MFNKTKANKKSCDLDYVDSTQQGDGIDDPSSAEGSSLNPEKVLFVCQAIKRWWPLIYKD